METHFGFPMRSYCCSIKWLTIYSNLVLYVQLLHSDGKDAASSLQTFDPFLALRFLVSFLSSLGGAPKIDLLLSMFSLANTFFKSLFSNSTLLVGETKTVVVVEAILGEIKIIP